MGWYFNQFDSDRQDLIDIQQEYIYFFEEYVIKPVIAKYLDACSIVELENDISRKLRDENFIIPDKAFRSINSLVALSFRWVNYNIGQDLFSTYEGYANLVISEWRRYNQELGKLFLSDNKLISNLIKIVYYANPIPDQSKDADIIFQNANDYIYWHLLHIFQVPSSCSYHKLKTELFAKYGKSESIRSPYFNSPKLAGPVVIKNNIENMKNQ